MIRVFILAALLSIGWFISSFEEPLTSSFEPIAVVELFTSQGCSSCPAADRVLSELIEGDESIFALSFHVSYWNYLGWKDPYSSEDFTTRQRNYSAAMDLGRVYTPQMVVNGTYEFVGSNKKHAETVLQKVLKTSPSHAIDAHAIISNHTLSIDYEISGSTEGYYVNAALVELDVSNEVPRGENRGRTLHHDNVVREFKTLDAVKSGRVSLKVPRDLNKSKSLVIIYIQDNKSLAITGASKMSL